VSRINHALAYSESVGACVAMMVSAIKSGSNPVRRSKEVIVVVLDIIIFSPDLPPARSLVPGTSVPGMAL